MAVHPVKGYASTADMDHSRHVVMPGAFAQSIREKGLYGPKGVKFLFAHKDDKPVGVIKALETRNRGLWIEAEIDLDISWGKDVAAASKAAGGLSFSVGFYLLDADIEEDAKGREYLKILRGELFEVSVVVFPANPEAIMALEEELTDDFDKAMTTLAKAKLTLESFQGQTNTTDKLTTLVAQLKRTFQ